MECPSCKTPVDSSQRFCPKCGALVGAEADAPDPLIGTTIGGKYKIVKMLGEGGMGCVYEGEQSLGTKIRRVAIKTLHAHLSKDPKIIARFQREVGTIAELEHPNTIQVYDFGSAPSGQLYIVMEYVQGLNLADELEKHGPMEPARAEKIMAQICGSLEEAHKRGIVHRDLKPENVVLTERAGKKDFVKVLDFGIAKRGGEEDKNEPKLTQAGMVLGTPPYMSPEQFTGKPIDARSDIYSLGVMAYEMVAGKLPFKAETAWEWATQHMTVAPIAIESTTAGSHVPAQMRAAIQKALAKSPDDRWATVKDFMEAFTATAGAAPAVSPGAGPAARGGTAAMAKDGAAAFPPAGGAASVDPAASGGGAPRAKTEVGTPLDPSYGAPAGASAQSPPYGGPATPAPYSPGGGPTPYPPSGGAPYAAQAAGPGYAQPGIPQAPARGDAGGGGGGKGILLALAGLLGIGAIVIVVFAMKGTGGPKEVDLGPINTKPPTPSSTAASAPTGDPTPAPLDSSLPPLTSGKVPPVHTGPIGPIPPHPTAPATTTNPGPTPPSPTTPPAPTTPPTTPPPPPPPPAPPVAKEPAACGAARQMRTLGMMKEFNNLAAQCRAQGGNP